MTFTYRFDGKSPLADQFVRVADAVAAALSAHGLSPAATCAVCGGGTPESLCVVTNSYQPVHAACMHQKMETTREKAQENQENGSYLTGIVGALLGALVGSILPILVLITSNTLYSLLFALVPLAAMYGYRLFKGKSNKISIVIVVLISLLFVALIDFVFIAHLLADYYHASFGQGLSFAFQNFDRLGQLMDTGDIVKTFLFMALGIVVSWGYLTKTSSAEVKGAETLLGTLRPNPMFNQGYAQEDSAAPQPPQQFFWNGQG